MIIHIGPAHKTRPSAKHRLKQCLASSLVITMLLGQGLALAQTGNYSPRQDAIQIRGSVTVGKQGEEIIPELSLRDAEIKDVLYTLSEQGGFNLIVDESVEGTISLDLKNVSINKIMEYILTLADLTYYKDGSTFIVTSKDSAEEKSLNKIVLKSVPVRHSNAQDLANVLNNTVFSINRPGGNSKAIATADPRTNSILIMGNDVDIDLANRALGELDFPLQHRTFFLKHASASEVANTIAQTLFSVSLTPVSGGGAGGGSSAGATGAGGGAAAAQALGSAMGGGGGAAQGGGAGGAAAGGGGAGAGGATLTSGVQVLKGGPVTFIANDANNTLTLIGTAEQIQLAEGMMYDVDIKPAQVAIQVSVIELNETKTKDFRPGINSNGTGGQGLIQLGSGNLRFNGDATTIFWNRGGLPDIGGFLNNLSLQTRFSQSKGKILANPTVLAVSRTTSTINVTNDVFAGTQVTSDPTTGLTQTSPIIKQVGISLNITPEVWNDGTVALSLTPTISSPSGTATDSTGNEITLTSSNTLNIARARVKDGQTLILGGLIRESSALGWSKVPFLSDIPILGAMFRASNSNSSTRTELVILVTPHIVKEEGIPYFRQEWKNNLSYNQQYADPNDPKNIVPTSNGANTPTPSGLQTLEQRFGNPASRPGIGGSTSKKSTSLPTYNEVLK